MSRAILTFMTGADKKIRIGLFDSGRGGFSILRELLIASDQFDCFYFADLLHHPYGPKSDQEILQRSHKVTQYLLQQNLDLIVVACNTATAVAIDELRASYSLPFVGIEPFLAAYEKFSKKPTDDFINLKEDYFTVLVTASMAKSRRFIDLKKRRDPEGKIKVHVCHQLASLVEMAFDKGWSENLNEILELDLLPLRQEKPDYAILGCTHYPLIKDKISAFLEAKTLSPCPFVVRRVFDVLGLDRPAIEQTSEELAKLSFFYSDNENRAFELRQAGCLSLS